MGALAITVIVGAGLLIGFGVQYLTHPRTQLDWLFVAIATGLGVDKIADDIGIGDVDMS